MSKLSALLCLAICSSFLSNSLFGRVLVEGNQRTRQSYIEHLIKKCQIRQKSDLEQCLLNSRIFSQVKVKKSGADLLVNVQERWTLIPIPNIKSGSDGSSAGLFLMEGNFLGMGKMAIVGGSIGSGMSSYFAMYADRELFYSDWILRVLMAQMGQELDAYDGERVTYSYNESSASTWQLALGREIANHLTAVWQFMYLKSSFENLAGYAAPKDNNVFLSGPELTYRNSDYRFYFNQGVNLKLEWMKQLDRTDGQQKGSKLSYQMGYQKNIWAQHALQLRLDGTWYFDESIGDIEKQGGRKSGRGIQENGLWARRLHLLSCDYQIPIASESYGTWTVAPFVEYGLYQAYYNPHNNYLSYGAGAYLYLKEVAMPGMGLLVGRNERFLGDFVSFRIGMNH